MLALRDLLIGLAACVLVGCGHTMRTPINMRYVSIESSVDATVEIVCDELMFEMDLVAGEPEHVPAGCMIRSYPAVDLVVEIVE